MLREINKPLLLIVVLGLYLRLIGINHGYPFVFHPDEPTIIRSALGIRFDINPAHFDWPHLYIYTNYVLYMVFLRIRNIVNFPIAIFWEEPWIFYLLTRIFTAILGALTSIPIYLTGKKLFNTKVGLLSALALAVTPFHVWHSHYALADVPMVFILSWGMYFSACIFVNKRVMDYLLAGLFIGLSASTKYNGGLSALMVPLATIFHNLSLKKKKKYLVDTSDIKNWILSGWFALIGFLIGTPFSLFDFDTFSRTDGPQGAFWQFKNVGSVNAFIHLNKFVTAIFSKLPIDMGYVFLFSFLLVLIYSIYQLSKKEINYNVWFVLLMALIFIWYISGFEKNRSHYYMISYPFIVLSFGYFFSLFKKINFKPLFYILLFIVPLILSLEGDYVFKNIDTRTKLHAWAVTHVSNDYVIYNDGSLKISLKDVKSKKTVKGYWRALCYKSGYIIVTNDDNINVMNITLDEVAKFDNSFNKGPLIKVYKFKNEIY